MPRPPLPDAPAGAAMPRTWSDAASACRRTGEAYVLATVLGVAGSSPREAGAKMVVTTADVYDTIGGGRLELKITERARELLAANTRGQELVPVPLGEAAGQCCGGHLTVLLEAFPAAALDVTLFGAGHVGRALVSILAELDAVVSWYDPREAFLPQAPPPTVHPRRLGDIEAAVAATAPRSHVVVMTHEHDLDEAICRAYLERGRFASLGLIGSETKAKRFRHRLAKAGIEPARLDRLRCPIGLTDVPGKLPMAVAVSLAGELLGFAARDAAKVTDTPPLRWRELKPLAEDDADGVTLRAVGVNGAPGDPV